jgi:hypothetical protein
LLLAFSLFQPYLKEAKHLLTDEMLLMLFSIMSFNGFILANVGFSPALGYFIMEFDYSPKQHQSRNILLKPVKDLLALFFVL